MVTHSALACLPLRYSSQGRRALFLGKFWSLASALSPDDRLLMLEPGWLALEVGSAAADLVAGADVDCRAGCGWLTGLGAGACKISTC